MLNEQPRTKGLSFRGRFPPVLAAGRIVRGTRHLLARGRWPKNINPSRAAASLERAIGTGSPYWSRRVHPNHGSDTCGWELRRLRSSPGRHAAVGITASKRTGGWWPPVRPECPYVLPTTRARTVARASLKSRRRNHPRGRSDTDLVQRFGLNSCVLGFHRHANAVRGVLCRTSWTAPRANRRCTVSCRFRPKKPGDLLYRRRRGNTSVKWRTVFRCQKNRRVFVIRFERQRRPTRYQRWSCLT